MLNEGLSAGVSARRRMTHDDYNSMYNRSINDPVSFWGDMAREMLHWTRDFDTVLSGSLTNGDVSWFLGGQLNACFNCVDRHALSTPDRVAIITEADEPGESRSITYSQLLRDVSQAAAALRALGVRKGDTVAVYMPMIAEALICLLAISRIGAIHCVVFAGFSSDSLADRIIDAEARIVVTTDEGKRGGKTVATKRIVDEALKRCPLVSSVLVYKRTGSDVPWVNQRDYWWHEQLPKHPMYVAPEPMNAEDPLFLLYTSGSTGKPKGVLHTTAGYLLGCATTGRYVFDLGREKDDVYFCGGDIGWITGHSYVLYAPLLLGTPTVVFEGTPAYPDYSRYWEIIDKHKVTHFYVAPTALRLLKRAGDDYVSKYAMQRLRVLGSVGEPIAPEVWTWYHDIVGKGKASVVDTYWQTETGSHIIAPLANVSPTKPGSASIPFFGIAPVILDGNTGEEKAGNGVEGILAIKQPWPSMARSVWKDHKRFMETYLNVYKGYYFTGDGAARDEDGLYWIKGRVDDVVNVSGHRLSTAEVESALMECSEVAEAAVVGVSDDLTGQAIYAFVSLTAKKTSKESDTEGMTKRFTLRVRQSIGPFAAPKKVYVVDELPKTRSGKIMRRILRKILSGEVDSLGDVSTLSDATVVDKLVSVVS